jgi:two-component system, LytTR family, response regulator
MNCLVIDDEPLALDLMETFISKIPFLNLVAKCNEPLLALPHLNQNNIDLLFLDIQMPDISGIEFFKTLSHKPEVIFTTAFSEYAIEGFELDAVDYLLKPISFERFVMAVNRAKDYIDFKNNKTTGNKEYFFINASHKIHKIFYKDILYLEGLKDYTKIYLAGVQNPFLILQNMKYFEDFLPKNEFVRIHRSYMVAIDKLNTVTKKAVTIGNHTVPVSDHYRDRLFAVIQQ